MSQGEARYRFYVHRCAPAWRLVLAADAAPPAQMQPADWDLTRERTAADTNPDVRQICAERGYCLMKIGGAFEDLLRDLPPGER